MGAVATAIACAIAKLIIKNGKSRIEDHQQFSILRSTSMLWTGPNSPASGPFLTAWRDEIQALIDELTCDAGLSTNSYRLTTFDFSQYQKLPEERR